MVRVNLLFTAGPGIYGTATAVDIVHITLAAIGFCTAVGLIVFGIVRILLI